ncbi:hypothetical protein BofuT4_uP127630.1 [Botrytis cinerea T4]|uniref:Uncharacterized protein n=1 Tax=Botryotinia fuckeliana (strain T4) TaxID=999810 RepID=G2YSW7_BOTF4|nr:hypothetical protein BofuT4_uP127630.1 [Botrytis cinerea T4]
MNIQRIQSERFRAQRSSPIQTTNEEEVFRLQKGGLLVDSAQQGGARRIKKQVQGAVQG